MALIDPMPLPAGCDAWVFPGQGAQQIGMSLDFAAEHPAVADLFAEADAVLGFAISRLIRDGPEGELLKTSNTQPAVYVASLAALKAAEVSGAIGSRPLFVSGHSLGEYSAVVAAGSLSFADGLRLVQERAQLMQRVGDEKAGGLAALLGVELAAAEAVCSATGTEVCNINAPGQIVVGGSLVALAALHAKAKEFGIRRVVPLKVSGAFHSSLMRPAAEGLAAFVSQLDFGEPVIPVVANGTARALVSAAELRQELVYQLDHPLLWEAGIRRMLAEGVERFTEFGPGTVLSGMIKRIDGGVETRNVGSLADLPASVNS